ncbi:MAG: hypothetical protein N3E45_04930 [Oscillatoriaceae bacterium SKW80]|nr:hypothetical protein [Oscillatoriaceae bacterium SKYG93]MCX8120159.1 hypothetical protein [Oscillatoriaceae bacterium SKW80]MDW8453085.1 hypothetical protein [Oscillatoriaceae cyanobacterium SKYGB_i_bin93]
MSVLFFAFLTAKIDKFYFQTIWVAIANLSIAFSAYFLLSTFNSELAFVSFITAISPTAISAPAIISFLKGNVDYVISVILTNSIVATILPFIIPFIHPGHLISTQKLFFSILFLFFTPLVLSRLLKIISFDLFCYLIKIKKIGFYTWILILFIASAKATHFILEESNASLGMITAIAIISLIICAVNFQVGRFIGGKEFAQEASQSLGQKNTMFTVWLSLSLLNPIVALGPMFYILYHNLYNSYQLIQIKNKKPNA